MLGKDWEGGLGEWNSCVGYHCCAKKWRRGLDVFFLPNSLQLLQELILSQIPHLPLLKKIFQKLLPKKDGIANGATAAIVVVVPALLFVLWRWLPLHFV